MKGRALALGGCVLATLVWLVVPAGAAGPPEISVDPLSHAFSSTCVGASNTFDFTISNTGQTNSDDLVVSSIDSSDQNFIAPSPPPPIPTGQTATMKVRFTPKTHGAQSGTITINSNASSSPSNVAVSGTGVDRRLSADRPTVSFGDQRVKTRSPTQTLTLTNKGGDPVRITNVARHGSGGRDFIVSAPAWPFTIPAGGVATVTVAFQPSTTGLRSGAVEFDSNACGAPVLRVGLVGTGVVPNVAVDPSLVDLGSSPTGVESAPTSVTVTNGGEASLKITAVQITGADADDFALSGLPVMPATLKPRDSFVFSVTMTPTQTGLRTAAIDVLSDDPDAPTFTVALTGGGGTQTASPSPRPTRSTRRPSPSPTTSIEAQKAAGKANDSLALGLVFGGVFAAFAGLLIVRRIVVAREEE